MALCEWVRGESEEVSSGSWQRGPVHAKPISIASHGRLGVEEGPGVSCVVMGALRTLCGKTVA